MSPSESTSAPLIASLARVLSELHGATVEVVTTHLSWVLLAGEFAYKIKRPRKFAFADFSTLAAREANCANELRLNQRFAPQLYLELVTLCGSVEAPELNGHGPAIEYAVRLRRFQRDQELAALVAAGAVSTEELAAFGQGLARIHTASPDCSALADRDDAANIALGNASELQQFAADRDQVRQLRAWLGSEWERIASQIHARLQAGRVRECHGDLHLGNVVRFEGALMAFDCLEFNEQLRCIDVISDVAFLVMDLKSHERNDLAYAFLNAWLQASGDYAGIALLRFFMIHRALVRAKVALIERVPARAGRYLAFALEATRAARPLLAITCGVSGSGKSWLSGQLLLRLGALRLRSDIERKRLAGIAPEDAARVAGGANLYSRAVNGRVYGHLLETARTLLRAGEHVMIDAAFLRRPERLAFQELAAEVGAAFAILHCVAPDAELRRRLRERQATQRDPSDADERVMERQHEYWEPFAEDERAAVLEIVTGDADCAERVFAQLGARLAGIAS